MESVKEREIAIPAAAGLRDYSRYDMPFPERAAWFLLGLIAVAVIAYIFYGIPIVAAVAGVLGGVAFVPIRKKQIIRKQTNDLKRQFRDLLESLSTSLSAGKNVPDSFRSSYDDLKSQYSLRASIVIETENILNGMNNNINIEDLLLDFAARSHIEDIASFANVFDTCYRKGGNIREVIKSTYQIINDKMEIDMEIETVVTSAKTEQRVMTVMPIIFMFILKSMGGTLTGQGTPTSIISTTVALAMFALAYFVGKKILAINFGG